LSVSPLYSKTTPSRFGSTGSHDAFFFIHLSSSFSFEMILIDVGFRVSSNQFFTRLLYALLREILCCFYLPNGRHWPPLPLDEFFTHSSFWVYPSLLQLVGFLRVPHSCRGGVFPPCKKIQSMTRLNDPSDFPPFRVFVGRQGSHFFGYPHRRTNIPTFSQISRGDDFCTRGAPDGPILAHLRIVLPFPFSPLGVYFTFTNNVTCVPVSFWVYHNFCTADPSFRLIFFSNRLFSFLVRFFTFDPLHYCSIQVLEDFPFVSRAAFATIRASPLALLERLTAALTLPNKQNVLHLVPLVLEGYF